MGIWGPGLYDNDCTADIKESFQQYINNGISPAQIKQMLLDEYADLFNDEEDGPLAKLAIAEQLCMVDALDPSDREAMIAYLLNGGDLDNWIGQPPDLSTLRKKELRRLLTLFRTPASEKKNAPKQRNIVSFPWTVGQVYALPLCGQRAKDLELIGEYLLFYIFSESEEYKGEPTPEVWIKLTSNGKLPRDSIEFNNLEYVQIACTAMNKRFSPFPSEDAVPKDYKQEYHPDDWGYLPEYSMSIFESKNTKPPKSLLLLGEYHAVLPPIYNYKRYRSAHGAVWKHLEDFVLLRYQIHNLRKGKMYNYPHSSDNP